SPRSKPAWPKPKPPAVPRARTPTRPDRASPARPRATGNSAMDRKIRIFFFPRDASRVRVYELSRRVALALLFTLAPLCLLGFWLVFSGALRESPERRFARVKLEREAAALSEKSGLLR